MIKTFKGKMKFLLCIAYDERWATFVSCAEKEGQVEEKRGYDILEDL